MKLRCRRYEFRFPRPALVMGIVNVTPDSFSDGGLFRNRKAAIAHGLQLVEEGAEILDIGGESTRPGAEPVTETEELRRVIPVIEGLASRVKVPISVDTMKPGVARAALAAGASIVNDVAAARQQDAMWELVAETGAGYVLMHSQGTPRTMQRHPTYRNVTREVGEFFSTQIRRLRRCGIAPEQIIVDPGIGFGKTVGHNLELLRDMRQFHRWRRPLALGVSRKAFIGKVTGADAADRLPGSLACACLAVADGVQIIRVHDVAATVRAIRMTEAILAGSKSKR